MGMTIADKIRDMSDQELGQFILDVAYESFCPIEEYGVEHFDIPSPLGGYLAMGLTDLHDIDIVVDALQEEVENGNDDR